MKTPTPQRTILRIIQILGATIEYEGAYTRYVTEYEWEATTNMDDYKNCDESFPWRRRADSHRRLYGFANRSIGLLWHVSNEND